tara:strand:+ start:59 stop:529 length:471 start_codon:yes stop_codon:yes gene_type:complete
MILTLISLVLFCSCDVQKRAAKQKEDRIVKEQTETIKKRVGDTVTFEVPKIIYKDTTIVKKNYVTGTTQVVRYDDNGRIDLVQCLSGAIEEITRSNKELVEAITKKDSEKTEQFDSDVILYGFIGLGFFIVIVGGAFIWFIKKQNANIVTILEKLL